MDTCVVSLTCSVADKGDKFMWSAANMQVSSPLMLPVNQEMPYEESKQGEANLQAEQRKLRIPVASVSKRESEREPESGSLG